VRLWDVATGRCLRTFEGHTQMVYAVALSPDGRLALSGSQDQSVRLWEVATGRCLRTLRGHTGYVPAVALAAGGRLALSGSFDGTVRLWEVTTGRCLRTFEGHTQMVYAVALSPDGRLALSGSQDESVRLWEVATGRCLRTLQGHRGAVSAVALSPDGRLALSCGVDKTTRVWFLNWELEEKHPADWDEGARPYLEAFLSEQTPYAAALPGGRRPTDEEIALALTRRGRPVWTEEDFRRLLYALGCAGYGWLRPEGIRRELEKMTAAWQGPPPLAEG
jgi:predicted NACHT family NTPase